MKTIAVAIGVAKWWNERMERTGPLSFRDYIVEGGGTRLLLEERKDIRGPCRLDVGGPEPFALQVEPLLLGLVPKSAAALCLCLLLLNSALLLLSRAGLL